MKGKIKWYKKDKGYGFIEVEGEKDYFVHYSNLPEDADNIDGKSVEFDVKEDPRGPQATNIKFLEEAEE